MSDSSYVYDWAKLAFGSKKPINDLKATFIMAPRELSGKRFGQLLKQYLAKGNVVLGIAKEDYIDGFKGQPQFRTLSSKRVLPFTELVAANSPKAKLYILEYQQREATYLLEKLKFKHVVLVNGSWLHAFHTRTEYYALVNSSASFEKVSPFVDEAEAKAFAAKHVIEPPSRKGAQTTAAMLQIADEAAKASYDYMFQTGAALGKKTGNDSYELVLTAYNHVVPYQTYAMHHGASRETYFSPPNDLNHYDTAHAEVELLIQAQKNKLSLADTTLFINLMPCPPCSRMLAETDIAEIVYQQDHSNGYAVHMLEAAGKTVTRVVAP